MTYKDVIEDFKNKCNSCCLSDDWLYNQQCQTRETSVMCGEYQYGIVYVRDDAVELLIDRINELEKCLSEVQNDRTKKIKKRTDVS